MQNKSLKIFCDGGARGNPGPAGIGVVIVEIGGRERRYKKYIGKKTNNQAEYEAVYLAMKILRKEYKNAEKADFFLDSELVVKQMKGEYKIKNEKLGKLLVSIRNIIIENDLQVSFNHILRAKNHHADKLVNWAIDEGLKKRK